MLKLTIIMNSGVEEILEFKCCNLLEMNLELVFQNIGDVPIPVPHKFILENDIEREEFANVYPPWKQTIAPRDYASIYCSMDERIWDKFQNLIITDEKGNESVFPIPETSQ